VIRVDTNLVLVPAVVTDQRGAVISGLPLSKFTVLEDKIPQAIVSVSTREVPVSIGVILDTSASMRDKLGVSIAAASDLLAIANPADEAFLLSVSTQPHRIVDFTSDFTSFHDLLLETRAEGDTALLDTTYLGLSRIRAARNGRRALIVISDGIDNHSRYSRPELLRLVDEADVQIFTIRVASPRAGKASPVSVTEEAAGSTLLSELARRSGGLSFVATTLEHIKPAARQIGRAIRDEYVLAYHPAPSDGSGRWRSIQVKISASDLRVAARRGYYAR
jgi:Ca-activated chloride channel family protein